MSFIKTKDGTEIFYKDWGKGQPIVFSHGWPLSADDWDAQMMFFLNQGYRVIAHDRRGHGRSSQTRARNHRPQAFIIVSNSNSPLAHDHGPDEDPGDNSAEGASAKRRRDLRAAKSLPGGTAAVAGGCSCSGTDSDVGLWPQSASSHRCSDASGLWGEADKVLFNLEFSGS
jgi:pimeloyl-ACP methyl ester carboxylesterase